MEALWNRDALSIRRAFHRLTVTRKLLLAASGVMAVVAPLLVGILNTPRTRAQSPEALAFEAASIKPAAPDATQVALKPMPGGGLRAVNVGLKEMIVYAYDIRCGNHCDMYISGLSGWAKSARFDIVAKGPEWAPEADIQPKMPYGQLDSAQDRVRRRLRALLAERFRLLVRRETRKMPVYALVVAKGGRS